MQSKIFDLFKASNQESKDVVLSEVFLELVKQYGEAVAGAVYDVLEEVGISYEKFRFVKQKLERYGLLQSRNQQLADENQELIVKYLQALDKEHKASCLKGIKFLRFKKLSHTDSHMITSLRRQYLSLIADVEAG